MLRIIQSRSAAAAKNYYSHSDYLSEGQELTGYYGGKAAAMLGLSGEVDKQTFDRLCDNQHPFTGDRLTLRNRTDRTPGYDFNFHCPKGVTLAYTLGQDERVLVAFRESVDETMREEIEPDAKTRVRKHGVDSDRDTGNLAWAGFIHTTTRPMSDGVPDGHLHGHYFVLNSTWDAKEQAWKAAQFRDLKRDASYYEAAFHARLAFKMRKLGYEIERHGKFWDIAGISKETKTKFSRRTEQIEKIAKDRGITDPKIKAELAAKTRLHKARDLTMSELRKIWEGRLSEEEKTLFAELVSKTKVNNGLEIAESDEHQAMGWAKKHCFERESVIPEHQLKSEALRHGVGFVTPSGIKKQLADHHIITRSVDGRSLATTPEMLAEEAAMIRSAQKGKGKFKPLNRVWTIKRSWLSNDQQVALQHILKSTDRLTILSGGAGTGKTTLMHEAIEGIESNGMSVHVFAPSAEASRGVLASEGFKATTVAELLVSEDLQKEIAGNAIWIDEAALIGTRTMKRVLDLAESNNARVILSGDWKQHGSVEAGAALRILEKQAGIKPAVVRSIQRQSGEYREAVGLLAEGKSTEGLEMLRQLGWVKEIEDDDERYATLAQDYANTLGTGQSVLAVAPTHAEGRKLTEKIRATLKTRNVIDAATERTFEQLLPTKLTEAEKQRHDCLDAADVLVFHKGTKNYKKGDRIDTKKMSHLHLTTDARCFEACIRQSMPLAKGDLIRITANGKTLDGKHRLNNGNTHRIKSFTDSGDIQLENGWTISQNYGFIAPGYTVTSHASQGKTVDHVFLAESGASFVAADREQFYVSVSRGRHGARIYTDSTQSLAEAVDKSRPRLSATELVHDSNRRLRVRIDQASRRRNKRFQPSIHTTQKDQEVAHG